MVGIEHRLDIPNSAKFMAPEYHVELEVEERVDAMLSHVKIHNPLEDNGIDEHKRKTAIQLLKELDIFDRFTVATMQTGQPAYEEDRFVTGLASLAFTVAGLHPIKSEAKLQQYTDFIYFLARSGDLYNIEKAWDNKRKKFGILSPPAVPFDIEITSDSIDFTDWAIRYRDSHFKYVDVFSAPQRYPDVVIYLKKIAPERRTIIDIACATGDFLLDNATDETVLIGVDRLAMQESMQDEMMIINRFGLGLNGVIVDPSIGQRVYLDAIAKSNITFIKGDMFSASWINKLDYTFLPHPRIVTCLNGVYPHYDRKSILRLLKNVLRLTPDYIVLGGGVPSLTFFDSQKNEWIPGKHFTIFAMKHEPVMTMGSDYSDELDPTIGIPRVSHYSVSSKEFITQ